jgi:hypothetical protein
MPFVMLRQSTLSQKYSPLGHSAVHHSASSNARVEARIKSNSLTQREPGFRPTVYESPGYGASLSTGIHGCRIFQGFGSSSVCHNVLKMCCCIACWLSVWLSTWSNCVQKHRIVGISFRRVCKSCVVRWSYISLRAVDTRRLHQPLMSRTSCLPVRLPTTLCTACQCRANTINTCLHKGVTDTGVRKGN